MIVSIGCTASEGGLRSWLAVRWTHTAALYLTPPPSCGGSAGRAACCVIRRKQGMRTADMRPQRKAQPMGGAAQRVAEAEPMEPPHSWQQTGLANRPGRTKSEKGTGEHVLPMQGSRRRE